MTLCTEASVCYQRIKQEVKIRQVYLGVYLLFKLVISISPLQKSASDISVG